MNPQNGNQELSDYNERLQAAEDMLPIIGRLWRDHGVPTYVYGNPLYLKGPTQILQAHRKARLAMRLQDLSRPLQVQRVSVHISGYAVVPPKTPNDRQHIFSGL